MKCYSCGAYFKQTPWNTGATCESCVDADFSLDQDYKVDIDRLQNPSGKTLPVFYDDRDEDSHGL